MDLPHQIANDRRLIISEKNDVQTQLDATGATPSVILLTAWEPGDISFARWGVFVEEMLERGCTYWVCAGTYAEGMHDLIDDIISNKLRDESIATSFHEDETAEEVINFFIYTTTIRDVERGALVAVLDPGIPQDSILVNLLAQHQARGQSTTQYGTGAVPTNGHGLSPS
jgi:hypothetical protein